jgi:hypothetical protein
MEDRLFEAHRSTRMRATLRSLLIGILGLLFLTLFSSACSNEKSKKPASAPIPVTVSIAIQKTVPVELRAIGNVQAYSTVTVKPKVVRCHLLACSTADDKDLTTRKTGNIDISI